jgi:hypothetical protein
MSAISPWKISDVDAIKRDVAAAVYVVGIISRCIVPGMPEDVILMRLAARGIFAHDWRLIRPLLESIDG